MRLHTIAVILSLLFTSVLTHALFHHRSSDDADGDPSRHLAKRTGRPKTRRPTKKPVMKPTKPTAMPTTTSPSAKPTTNKPTKRLPKNVKLLSVLCKPKSDCRLNDIDDPVIVDKSIELNYLLIRGGTVVKWDTDSDEHIVLKAGWILVLDDKSRFQIGEKDDPMTKPATIYILNNNAPTSFLHDIPVLKDFPMIDEGRFFGSVGARFSKNPENGPAIRIYGLDSETTWTLLTADAWETSKISVDPPVADWKIGDQIAIAPTDLGYPLDGFEMKDRKGAHQTTILDIQDAGKTIVLKDAISKSQYKFPFLGDKATGMQAEVLRLSRNIVITGDYFTVGTKGESNVPDQGLSTWFAHSGWHVMQGVRVDYCGNRRHKGRYCVHFHLLSECPKCVAKNLAIVDSWQRGIAIHGTHYANIINNVLFNVRGANIYVEDGNEFGNIIESNVNVCGIGGDHETAEKGLKYEDGISGTCMTSFMNGEEHGCRLARTDNPGADCVQQSGLWALSPAQYFRKNRFVNHYNAMYFQTSTFPYGKTCGDCKGQVAARHTPFGIIEENVSHSCRRFGFYPDANWPRNVDLAWGPWVFTDDPSKKIFGLIAKLPKPGIAPSMDCETVANPVYITDPMNYNQVGIENCLSSRVYTCDGVDNGQSRNPFTKVPGVAKVKNNFDYFNQYVGQYELGDVQYDNQKSYNNHQNMYWKWTKNFSPSLIGTPHILGGEFGHVSVLYDGAKPSSADFNILGLPAGHGTMIIQDVKVFGSTRNVANSAVIGTNQDGMTPGIVSDAGSKDAHPDDGSLSNPVYHFVNLDLSEYKGKKLIYWGTNSGSPYLGTITTFDSADVFGGTKGVPRSIVSGYNKHLLAHPNCKRAQGQWDEKLSDGIVCDGDPTTKDGGRVRRLDIWIDASSWLNDFGLDLTKVVLTIQKNPPDNNDPKFEMVMNRKKTQFTRNNENTFVRGYSAVVLAGESYSIKFKNGTEVSDYFMNSVTALEFSDVIYSPQNKIQTDPRFQVVESVTIQMNGKTCKMSSDHSRLWLGQYGVGNIAFYQKTGACVNEFFSKR